MMIFKNKTILAELLFIILLSLIPLLWFIPDHMLIGFDSGYPVDFIGYFQQRTFTWLSSQNFGVDISSQMGQLPLHALQAVVSALGVGQYNVQKVTFVFWFLLVSFSMYALIYYLYPKASYWIIRLFAVVLFAVNFYIFSFWIQGSQSALASYSLIPLTALILIKFFRKQLSPLSAAVYLSLAVLFLNAGGVYGIPVLGSAIATAVTIFIFFIFLQSNEGFKMFKRVFLMLILFILIAIPLNSFWLLPFSSYFQQLYTANLTQVGGVEAALGWTNFISEHTSFLNLFRLQGDLNWYNHPGFYSNAYLENPLLISLSFIFPGLAYLAYLLVKNGNEKVNVLLFTMISFVGLFLSAGTHGPFGWIYGLLLEHIPGFAAFRSPYYKFMPIVVFSFSILGGITLYYLLKQIRFTTLRTILGITAIILLMLYHYPIYDKGQFEFNKPFSMMVNIPDYVLDYAKFEKSVSNDYKTLVLPAINYNFPIKAYTWSYWSVSPLFTGLSDNAVVMNDAVLLPGEKAYIRELYQALREGNIERAKAIAKKINIKYLLLTEDITPEYHTAPTEEPKFYKNILEKNSDSFRVVWKNGPWNLYEIRSEITPKLYTVNSVDLYQGVNENSYKLQSRFNHDFVLEQDLTDANHTQLLTKLPINSRIRSLTCVSCIVLEDNSKVVNLQRPNVLPSSFLYKYKHSSINLDSSDQSLEQNLKISLAKAGEISAIKDIEKEKIEREVWLPSIITLTKAWENINNLTKSKVNNLDNFNELYITYLHNQIEKNDVATVYRGLKLDENDTLMQALAKSIEEMDKVEKLLDKDINRYEWKRIFMYDLGDIQGSEIVLDTQSIPLDNNNDAIYPSVFTSTSSSAASPKSVDATGIVQGLGKNLDSKIFLEFKDFSNSLGEVRTILIDFPSKKEECLYAPIQNYSWDKKYVIGGKLAEDLKGIPIDELSVYTKTIRGTFMTKDLQTKNNYYFQSDVTFPMENLDKNGFTFLFSGFQNDKNATVYFCGPEKSNPEEIFTNLYVQTPTVPIVYAYDKKSSAQENPPKISFKQIDPTKYEIAISDAKGPFILGFLERYSSNWEIKFKDSGQEINDHFMLNGFANGWLIDKKGSYSLIIDFYPQKLFVIGSIISITSFCLVVLLLVYKLFRRNSKNNAKI